MTTWTREMAVELAREEYERGLAEGRAEAAAAIAQEIEALTVEPVLLNQEGRWWRNGLRSAIRIAREYAEQEASRPVTS